MPNSSSNALKESENFNVSGVSAVSPIRLPFSAAAPLDGLLALLVTDLEGFTSLVEQLGDARAQTLMRQHNRMLRASIRRRRGQEVAHTGDGILAAFRSVSAALLCARDVHIALEEHSRIPTHAPLRARIGIHAGEPLPEESRLFGHCVNTAVRVCGAASAGTVLVTDVVKQLTQGRFSFGSGAAHDLKGLSSPVQLYDFAWRVDRRSDGASL